MKKIIICVITFIVSITAGVGSFAVNDLGSYQQWMDDNRPLIKVNLHKDKSHKENKHEKDSKHNHRDVNKQHPKEERHEVSVPVKETNNPEPDSLPAPDAMPSALSEESAGQR